MNLEHEISRYFGRMYGTWQSLRMTSYAGEVVWRCTEISGPIKRRGSIGRVEKKVRAGTWRESCDLRSRRKPPVLHIRRMMSFVSSFHRPAALNSLYLEFQEERPSYDDINTRERYTREGGARHISRDTIVAYQPLLYEYTVC